MPACAPALLNGAALLFLWLALCLPSGYSVGALLLLLLGLWRAPQACGGICRALRGQAGAGAGMPGERPLAIWALTIAGMGLIWAMHIMADGQLITHSLGLDRCIKYLLVLLALPALYGQRPSAQALRLGCWLGAGGAGLLALWQVLAQGEPRAFGHTNAIQFGNLALLLGLWSAVWAWQARHQADAPPSAPLPAPRPASRYMPWLGWLAALLGLAASVASGSRGGWLALPLLVLALLWRGTAVQRLRALAAAAAASLLLLALPPVQERVQLAWHEYQSQRMDNTSIGLRLSFWQLARELGQAHPWLGAGQVGYEQAQRQAVAQQRMPSQAVEFNHAHNEWLDMLAKRGMLGVAALALFYAVPAALLGRQLRSAARQAPDSQASARQAAALCGLCTVLGFVLFGLTQVMFAHNSGNMMYLLGISLWLSASMPAPAARPGRPAPAPEKTP